MKAREYDRLQQLMFEALHYFAVLARHGQVNRHDTLGARCGRMFVQARFNRVSWSVSSSVHRDWFERQDAEIQKESDFATTKYWCRYNDIVFELSSAPGVQYPLCPRNPSLLQPNSNGL